MTTNPAVEPGDVLTGLPGRPAISRALNTEDGSFQVGAVLFVDLDRFKWINDSMGHAMGDEVLKNVSRRLVESVRDSDLVARFGGDEFVVIMSPIKTVSDTTKLARRIVESIGRTMTIDERNIAVGASVGIAIMSEGAAAAVLLQQADLALYEAKRRGGNRHVIFDHRLAAMAEHRVSVERSIRGAIEEERLSLHYQPIVEMSGRTIAGYEALARLVDVEMGPVSPAEFIPLAGEIGYMKAMGRHLRHQLMRDVASAQHDWADITFAFNLSPAELEDRNLADQIAADCEEFGMRPTSLTLELSEDMLVQDRIRLERTVRQLRELGIRISLDDFGTGRASLTSLKELPVDEIKIDRSFVTDIADSRFNRATCEAIVLLAEALDASVVAEGIESETEAAVLAELGITYGQGYLFAKPSPMTWDGESCLYAPGQVL